MKKSAGIVLKWKDKVLICHPTNSPQTKSYSFPKGGIEFGESPLKAALRELNEEVGIQLNLSLKMPSFLEEVRYVNKKGTLYKKVYLYLYEIDNLSEVGLEDIELPSDQLQLDEVDSAFFANKEEYELFIHSRFSETKTKIFQ